MPDRKPSASPPPPSPGLAARRIAADIVVGVLRQKRPLDDLLEQSDLGSAARARPRPGADHRRDGAAPARHAAASARGACSKRGLPKSAPNVEDILLIGAAQILFLDVPDHASVDLSVRLAQADHSRLALFGLGQRACCGSSRATARPELAATRHHAARYARVADASAGSRTTARRRRAPSPWRTPRSRRSISR